MIKVLVIGANSYIGQKFREYISHNNLENLAVDMASASDGAWRKVDFSRYDTILHLSGIVHRKEKKSMEALYYEVNHRLVVDIAGKAKENNVKQFIFMSTAAVYGIYSGCITKDTLPNPSTFYGKSKLAAEKEIIQLHDDKFKVAILRPPMIYGEGSKGNYLKLVKLAKYTPILPEIHNRRSILSINNLSKFIVNIITTDKSGYFYPQNNTYLDTCELIAKIRKENGKKTIMIRLFNKQIEFLMSKLTIFRKLFGDLYYEEEL